MRTPLKTLLIAWILSSTVASQALAQASLVTPLPAADRSPATKTLTKADVISALKNLQTRQQQEINSLEEQLRKRLKDTTAISLKEDSATSEQKTARVIGMLATLDDRREEMIARRVFIDQLILAFDSKWNGRELQTFLEHQLLDMAATDLTNPQGASQTWKFIVYLSIAIREIPEPHESPLGIIESFMSFASILNPKTPTEYLTSRNYTNSASSYTARPAERGQLGEYLETRMKELKKTDSTPVKSARPSNTDIELRIKTSAPQAEPLGTAKPEPSIRE